MSRICADKRASYRKKWNRSRNNCCFFKTLKMHVFCKHCYHFCSVLTFKMGLNINEKQGDVFKRPYGRTGIIMENNYSAVGKRLLHRISGSICGTFAASTSGLRHLEPGHDTAATGWARPARPQGHRHQSATIHPNPTPAATCMQVDQPSAVSLSTSPPAIAEVLPPTHHCRDALEAICKELWTTLS